MNPSQPTALTLVCALLLTGCADGSPHSQAPRTAVPGPNVPATPGRPSTGLSEAPCTPSPGSVGCGAHTGAYTLTQARSRLLAPAEVGRRTFPRRRSATGSVVLAPVCDWRYLRLTERKITSTYDYRLWSDGDSRRNSRIPQRVYRQIAIVYTNPAQLSKDLNALWHYTCQRPQKRTAGNAGEWKHYRRTQSIACYTGAGRCVLITDYLTRNNLLVVTSYEEVRPDGTQPNITERLFSALTAKLNK
ncbi:hypothetical protein [Actinomadura craniellae]|uniref:hypothetical protein n=1 Tax=Actinomadura craniellae TaxID=2231787 RepID=UPI0011BF7472|nr:hypothetical protein [Actinomadura craniellae]